MGTPIIGAVDAESLLRRIASLEADNATLRTHRDGLTQTCAALRRQRDEANDNLLRVTAELLMAAETGAAPEAKSEVDPVNPTSTPRLRRAMRRSKEECETILAGRHVDDLMDNVSNAGQRCPPESPSSITDAGQRCLPESPSSITDVSEASFDEANVVLAINRMRRLSRYSYSCSALENEL